MYIAELGSAGIRKAHLLHKAKTTEQALLNTMPMYIAELGTAGTRKAHLLHKMMKMYS